MRTPYLWGVIGLSLWFVVAVIWVALLERKERRQQITTVEQRRAAWGNAQREAQERWMARHRSAIR